MSTDSAVTTRTSVVTEITHPRIKSTWTSTAVHMEDGVCVQFPESTTVLQIGDEVVLTPKSKGTEKGYAVVCSMEGTEVLQRWTEKRWVHYLTG